MFSFLRGRNPAPTPAQTDTMPADMVAEIMMARVAWRENHADPYGAPRCLVTFTGGMPWVFTEDEQAAAALSARWPGLSPNVLAHAVRLLNRRVADVSRAEQVAARNRMTRRMRDCHSMGEWIDAGMPEDW